MEKKISIRKKLITPNIIFLGFIVASINSLFKGIEHHETWRIVAAAAGGLIFVGFVVLSIYAVIKDEKTIDPAQQN
jgi:ABC-type enterochelin transport system permease subunit